jgi:hypothetical protein
MKLSRQIGLACGTLVVGLAAARPADALILTHVVGPMDNLYNTAWVGNLFQPGSLGTGTDAEAVSSAGSPYDFSGNSTISIAATGCIVDAGSACTGPDGLTGSFRGLPVYSMIGLWSSTGASITAIGVPFFVGSAAMLPVPGGGPAYLFLAENDGLFLDNTAGQYDVTIEVPEPATLSLIALGGVLMAARRRRDGR